MFKYKMELTLKICIMPFTEYEFYKTDYLEQLLQKNLIEDYNKCLKDYLLKSIYNILNRSQRINNLDEVNLLFNKFFPRKEIINSDNINKFYINFISKMSKAFITDRNGRIALKYWESNGEEDFIGPYKGINKVALWNSLNRMFTTDLLVIRYLIDNGMKSTIYLDRYYSSIMLEDIQLEKILKKGVAETHIHKGAAINFYISWQQLMSFRKKLDSYKDDIFYDDILGKNIKLKNYVGSMSIIRLVIADFLKNYSKNGYNLVGYLNTYYKNKREEYLKLKNFIENSNYEDISYEKRQKYIDLKNKYSNKKLNKLIRQDNEIYNIFRDVFEGNVIEDNRYRLYELWERCKEKLGIYVNKLDKNGIGQDVLNNIFLKEEKIKTTMENVFLFKCMLYMEENSEDNFFNKIFWQYVRIKNEVFKLKVQRNSIKGLENFSKCFKRSTNIHTDNSKEYWKIIMLNQLQNIHLKKLELRSGFGEGNSEVDFRINIKNTLRYFLEAYKEVLLENFSENEKSPSIGLIFHMIKDFDRKGSEKCWQNHCDVKNNELYFMEIQAKYKKQVKALNYIREKFSGISEYILGIDAASIENNTEPWVFAPVYEEARNSTNDKLVYNKNTEKIHRIKSLGFTFHVGEDFRHIITGIRRIDEVVEHFKFHAGDRIGHGIALGINVEKWSRNNKIIILPRGEYIDNLLWIWGTYKDNTEVENIDIAYIEREIMRNCEKIYHNIEGISIYVLWKAYRRKFYTFHVKEKYKNNNLNILEDNKDIIFCKYADKSDNILWNEEKLLHSNHCKVFLEKMLEPIQIEITNKDIKMIKEAQKIVLNKISSQGIIVETNPTSNVTIGEVESIFDHYAYNLNKKGLNNNQDVKNSVMISINSDDPSVFNTNVSNEFSYIFYSLQEKGYSREEILMWIDNIRRYGMEYSFIDDRELTVKDRIIELNNILNELEKDIKG
ncbi:hypothetical protein ACSXAG_06505 [Clostridium perfringens]